MSAEYRVPSAEFSVLIAECLVLSAGYVKLNLLEVTKYSSTSGMLLDILGQ